MRSPHTSIYAIPQFTPPGFDCSPQVFSGESSWNHQIHENSNRPQPNQTGTSSRLWRPENSVCLSWPTVDPLLCTSKRSEYNNDACGPEHADEEHMVGGQWSAQPPGSVKSHATEIDLTPSLANCPDLTPTGVITPTPNDRSSRRTNTPRKNMSLKEYYGHVGTNYGTLSFLPCPTWRNTKSSCTFQALPIVADADTPIQQRHYTCPFSGNVDSKGPLCDHHFSRPEHLSRHIRTVHGTKHHVCKVPQCQRGFTRSDNLRDHYWTHIFSRRRIGRNAKMTLQQLNLILGPEERELVLKLRGKLLKQTRVQEQPSFMLT